MHQRMDQRTPVEPSRLQERVPSALPFAAVIFGSVQCHVGDTSAEGVILNGAVFQRSEGSRVETGIASQETSREISQDNSQLQTAPLPTFATVNWPAGGV
jgi:hypothetical protein